MLLVTKENKLIINKLEMNEDSLKNLYDFVSDKRAIKDIKFINENAPKYYTSAFTSGEYVIYIEHVYNYSRKILENILKNNNENIDLLMLVQGEIKALKEIKTVLEKMNSSIAPLFLRDMYKDFYYFSTEILEKLKFIKTDEIEISKINLDPESFEFKKLCKDINLAISNDKVLRIAKKTNDFSKKLQP